MRPLSSLRLFWAYHSSRTSTESVSTLESAFLFLTLFTYGGASSLRPSNWWASYAIMRVVSSSASLMDNKRAHITISNITAEQFFFQISLCVLSASVLLRAVARCVFSFFLLSCLLLSKVIWGDSSIIWGFTWNDSAVASNLNRQTIR